MTAGPREALPLASLAGVALQRTAPLLAAMLLLAPLGLAAPAAAAPALGRDEAAPGTAPKGTPAPAPEAGPEAALLPAGPYALTAEAGVGLGFFFATHGRVGLSVGRRFVRYLDLHAAFTLDAGEHLLGFEEAVGAGLVLPLKERWELTFGWRLGVVSFRGDLPAGVLWTTALMVSVVVEARYLLTRRWELRFAPVSGTGFWSKIWGFVLSPTLGAAVRF